jgi:hypothetical protein
MAKASKDPRDHLGEPDLEAFFLAGEKGTYEGGPAHSLSPLALEGAHDEAALVHHGLLEDAGQPALTAEQLARREHFRRRVTALVAGLGAASILAIGAHALRGQREEVVALAQGAATSPRLYSASEPAPLVPAVEGVIEGVTGPRPGELTPRLPEGGGHAAPEPRAEPRAEQAAAGAPRAVLPEVAPSGAARSTAGVVRRAPQREALAAAPPPTLEPERPRSVLSAVRSVPAAVANAPAGYIPPTASFPD